MESTRILLFTTILIASFGNVKALKCYQTDKTRTKRYGTVWYRTLRYYYATDKTETDSQTPCLSCQKTETEYDRKRTVTFECNAGLCPKLPGMPEDGCAKIDYGEWQGISCCCSDKPLCNGGITVVPTTGFWLILALGALLKIHGSFL